jgi:hypothetical protein
MKWTILPDYDATRSDHEVIEWVADADRQDKSDQVRVVGWNLDAITEEDME